MSEIIGLCNQKGGVGKTTTAINLAASIAAAEKRVLLVDFDPQSNATSGLGFDKNSIISNSYSIIVHGEAERASDSLRASESLQGLASPPPVAEPLEPPPQRPFGADSWGARSDPPLEEVAPTATSLPFLDLIPSTSGLVGAEVELVGLQGREFALRRGLEPYEGRYDYILVDSPPSLGLLTVNVLSAARFLIVPVQCEYYALEGLTDLMRTIELVRDSLNPELEILGLLLTMFDARNNLAHQVEGEIRKHFGDKVFCVVIPRNVRLSEAPSHGKPVLLYDVRSKGAECYLELAREFLERIEGRRLEASVTGKVA